MRWIKLAMGLIARLPGWLALALAVAALAGLIWGHGALTARRAAELEALRLERVAMETASKDAEELRDDFRKIDERSAAGGDDAVLQRLRDGKFGVIPDTKAAAGD